MIKKNSILIGVVVVFVLSLLPLSSRAFPSGDPPEFIPGIRLQDSSGDIGSNVLDQYSVPCVADWNEDGKQDLLIGYFIFGPIYLYLNSGTNTAPVFTAYTKLKADGADLAAQWT
jgi:hypothetical protein